MWEVGDTIPLSVQTFAADGVTLTDANPAPVLTLTPPGYPAAPLVPAIAHPGVGTYLCEFVAPAAGWGLWHSSWVSGGTLLSAFIDSFLVVDGVNTLLIGLEDARASLRNAGDRATLGNDQDDRLRAVIAAARGIMEDLCGPIIPQVIAETQDGGRAKIVLDSSPVISITSIQESWGSNVRTLTNQPLGGAGFDAWGYTAYLPTGTVTRRASGSASRFARGSDNILVGYVAGRAVMPPNLYEATCRLVRWLWQGGIQGARPTGTRAETVTQTPSGHNVPVSVVRLCAGELRIPGMA